jgi:hypothetical protein
MKALSHLRNIFLILGLAFLVPSIVIGSSSMGKVRSGVITTGRILEVIPSSTAKAAPTLVIGFTNSAGSTDILRSPGFRARHAHSIGESVDIIYNPMNASEAAIYNFHSLWFVPLTLAIFSLTCLTTGYIFHRQAGRLSAPKPQLHP